MRIGYMVSVLLILSACSGVTEPAPPVKVSCDALPSPCHVEDFTVQFSQRPMPLKPFQVALIQGANKQDVITAVEVDFSMRDMAMGLNRYRLMRNGDRWIANAMLPVCVQGRADWNMQVEVHRQGHGQDTVKRYWLGFTSTQP